MKNKHYVTVKHQYDGENVKLNSSKIDGFEIKPKNNVKYDAVEVNSMTLINKSFIEKLLKKKIQKKLDYYLQYIISLIDEDDETSDPTNLKLALNDLAHYKSIVEYKYRKYLDEKYINLLLKKIDILEHEIKTKMVYKQMDDYNEYEEVKDKAR